MLSIAIGGVFFIAATGALGAKILEAFNALYIFNLIIVIVVVIFTLLSMIIAIKENNIIGFFEQLLTDIEPYTLSFIYLYLSAYIRNHIDKSVESFSQLGENIQYAIYLYGILVLLRYIQNIFKTTKNTSKKEKSNDCELSPLEKIALEKLKNKF